MKKTGLSVPKLLAIVALALCLAATLLVPQQAAADAETNKASAIKDDKIKDEKREQIESALYTRTEFFGTQALVSYPTMEAHNRLVDLLKKYPDDAEIYQQLAQLDEQLGDFAQAEKRLAHYVELNQQSVSALVYLADFYGRTAQFAKQAEVLEKCLLPSSGVERAEILRQLIELARVHRLSKYLQSAFYQQIIKHDPSVFEVIDQYIEKLKEEEHYQEALETLRQYKAQFPDQKIYLLEKEVELLITMDNEKEAERVYVKAFDPCWREDLTNKFYSFLSDHDRYRAYGRELKQAFNRNPTDYELAIRLLHFSKHDYDFSPETFVQLEKARAARGIRWQPHELAAIADILITTGYGEIATRFLYTLYLQGELKPGSELRAKVLYHMFRLLIEARYKKSALTKGDLQFYQDIATADPHPGIIGGILSLLMSDTAPKEEFELEQRIAAKYLNRAAAYRIFIAYKQEYPTSPELAQMYLDIVQFYSANGESKIALEALNEFEQRYQKATRFPEVAIKLADCYIRLEKYKEEREIYLRIMDYLGKHRNPGQWLMPILSNVEGAPVVSSYPPTSNAGINIRDESDEVDLSSYSYDSYEETSQQPYSLLKPTETVDYDVVLARYVASLARENLTTEILALYSNEIKKYPDEQGLYEQMLQWLGQTNLVEEELKVYQQALKQFPTMIWHDRMARWFIRHERKEEFAQFSRELLMKLESTEIESYLTQFIDSASYSSYPDNFQKNLYLGLYSFAHHRFPHNIVFVNGLLKYYQANNQWQEWQNLLAQYYFESYEMRRQFLEHLASKRELRTYLSRAYNIIESNTRSDTERLTTLPYKLFRADAAIWLSNFEEAIDAYRELNRLYPNRSEFAGRLVTLTRSFGQHNRKFLEEAAAVQHNLAEAMPASIDSRTRAGEIQAELGDYRGAKAEWEELIKLGSGDQETYLNTATVYWDYFQYDDALHTIMGLRKYMNNERLYAFQAGAILEAKHKVREALYEYVKALDENEPEHRQARSRLVTLCQRSGISQQLDNAFAYELQRRRDRPALILGYVEFLREADRWNDAATLLQREIKHNSEQDFLERIREIFAEENEYNGETVVLERLAQAAKTYRYAISYQLQLADVYSKAGNRNAAATILHSLVTRFPNNYGVLNEVTDYYWRLGMRESSMRVLQQGLAQGKGRFHYHFARKLALCYLNMNRPRDAQIVLTQLHRENRLNIDLFHELSRVCVINSDRATLNQAFRETIDEIKSYYTDVKELQAEIAELREKMIIAFTKLKDYRAAIEQHIEIINRDPDDQEKLDAALEYAQRYGGAEVLFNYYQETARQAYKNYRWNLVLARICEAKGNFLCAVENYHNAIDNQPGMVELYDALAEACVKIADYNAALDALNKAVELTNEDPRYFKRIVEVLQKAGRHREAAEIAHEKLPPEEPPKKHTVRDQFAEAEQLQTKERAKSIELYRKALDAFLQDPYQHRLNSAEITGYVRTVRYEDGLDKILEKFWVLREKLIQESQRNNNLAAGKARELLQVIDGAMPQAIGGITAEQATGVELAALYKELDRYITTAIAQQDQHGTISLLSNLCYLAGFAELDEKILLSRRMAADNTGSSVIDLYIQRGNYHRALELLEERRNNGKINDLLECERLIAETARLLEDQEKELQALRNYYAKLSLKSSSSDNSLVARYFEILYERGDEGKKELRQCLQNPSPYHLQLINFLILKGEKELTHEAISNAPFPVTWKLSRNAQASLAFNEFTPSQESYFLDVLQYKTIGEMITQKLGTNKHLSGDEWYHMAENYGRWLYLAYPEQQQNSRSHALLLAMIENRPKDHSEQLRLARWYLQQNNPRQALPHLLLAREALPEDYTIINDLGVAYLLLGDKRKALEEWSKLISANAAKEPPAIDNVILYLNTLTKYGLAKTAQEQLFPIAVSYLNQFRKSDYDNNDDESFEHYKPLISALNNSFNKNSTEAEKISYFHKLCQAVAGDTKLAEMLITDDLLPHNQLSSFYQILIDASSGLSGSNYDYQYTEHLQDFQSISEAENTYEHSIGFNTEEPDSERFEWQKAYLAYLIEQHKTAEALKLISDIESELHRRYLRPEWLRLARARMELHNGKIAQAMKGLLLLTGIETLPNIKKIQAPEIERLNHAVTMLKSEGHTVAAEALLQAAYERFIALEQYRASYFIGLARRAFEKGDTAGGFQLLNLMIELSQQETEASAIAKLQAFSWIKTRAVADTIEKPGPINEISYGEAIKLAAEITVEYGHFNAAIDYRKQLLTLDPNDEASRIELIRLLGISKQTDAAASYLAALIVDRSIHRQTRWQAIWLAPEIIGLQQDLWTLLENRALLANDPEMINAVRATYLLAAGNNTESIKIIKQTETICPNPYLKFYRALAELRSGHQENALTTFISMLAIDQKGVIQAFGEEESLRQVIRLYALMDQPRAALKLAETDSELKKVENNTTTTSEKSLDIETEPLRSTHAYQSMEARLTRRWQVARLELFELLSRACEQTGNFSNAINYQRSRMALVYTTAEKHKIEQRIEQLLALQKQQADKQLPLLTITQGLIAQR
ncbi:MAG: hypothetical protein AB1489_09320 [Acidobacteriota bacterium]